MIGQYRFLPGAGTPTEGRLPEPKPPAPGEVRVNSADGQPYVWVPPGSFNIGCSPGDIQCEEDESPRHPVAITRGFWLGQTEVTVGAWKRYRATMGKPRLPTSDALGRTTWNEASGNDRNPAVFVTWDEAQDFCRFAGGRLATEAEWEYASRAGSMDARYGSLTGVAWYGDNSGRMVLDSDLLWRADSSSYARTLYENGGVARAAGLKLPNRWNLYDMLGNVWEWVADWYDERYYQSRQGADPAGPRTGRYRALRGGSWYTGARTVRVSSRRGYAPLVRSSDVGCRCARSVNP